MMSEIVPRLIAQLPQEVPGASPSSSSDVPQTVQPETPRASSQKRAASNEPTESPEGVRPRTVSTEALFCQETLDMEHLHSSHVEILMAAFLQKRAQKELPATGNTPDMQHRIDEAKLVEWETVSGKAAVRVHTGAKAREIKEKFGHRFIGSRFVVTNKVDEEGSRVKARWCLLGHNDPDFHQKIASGECHSPTMHQLSRAWLLQVLVSKGWTLNLGDIKGAFLEAGPIPEKYRPLFAAQPPGGIPGVDPSAVIEIVGNLYGANDAPAQWYKEFDAQAQAAGFQRSIFDPCLYYYREPQRGLTGILGAHVDDTIMGGEGEAYNRAIQRLKARFQYRKWRQGSGEFCGVQYFQDPESKEITYDQKAYAQNIRPIAMTKDRQKQRKQLANEREITALRAVNGALNWLASQTRPDISVQASFSQQAFPSPTVEHLLSANEAVHRARQYSDVALTVRHVPWEDLNIVFHSDAGFANASQGKTQAGYILAFTTSQLAEDQPSVWSPFCWKSYKMSRVVASTLAGETQSFATASGISEWMSLMVSEAKHGCFDLRACEDHLRCVPITGVTDCKSLFDALNTPTSPGKIEDKRVAIDLAIVRQSMSRCGLQVRWCPTQLMIADGLTKNQADPADLMRALLANGVYQLSNEAEVLAQKKAQRDRRVQRKPLGSTNSPSYEQSQTPGAVFREVYLDHEATSYHSPEEEHIVQGKAVRRTSFDARSGKVLASEDLQESLLCEKQWLSSRVSLLRTEIWYERVVPGSRV